MKNVGVITSKGELREAKQNSGVVLYHSHMCGYCKTFLPVYEELAREEPQMFYEAEASAAGDVMAEDGIMAYPTLIYWYRGKRHQLPLSAKRTKDVVRAWLKSVDSGRVISNEEVRAPGKSCSAKSGQCSDGGRHANRPVSGGKVTKHRALKRLGFRGK